MGRIRIPRLPWDQWFMLHAHLAATRSTCSRGPELLLDPVRRGVGAVIVRDFRIIAGGYNGSPPGEPHCSTVSCADPDCPWEEDTDEEVTECPDCGSKDLVGGHLIVDGHCVRTLHAEENALLQCVLDGVSAAGGTVFTTASPCWDCAKRLVRVGVRRVVHGTHYDSRYGLSGKARALLVNAGVEVEHLDVSQYLWELGE